MVPSLIQESKQIPPQKIKVDDTVIVTCPEFVVRVGYPLSFEAALKYVEEHRSNGLARFLGLSGSGGPTGKAYKSYKVILKEMAKLYLIQQNYGGKERTIHTERCNHRLGVSYTVTDKKFV